jgi:NADH dehydrogenase/NADH:ubiquinone oxidoreductase subunit G
MKTLKLEIDGRPCEAHEGDTVLQVARAAGIDIPTLCHDEGLTPYGGCRLCMVEVTRGKRTRMVASCVYPAEEGLKVQTDTEKVRKVRRVLLELLLPLADTGPLRALATKYGIEKSRFAAKPTDCVLCGLCVRYCAEKKKAHAVYFQHRGVDRKLVQVDPKSGICIGCKQCFELCPSGLIVEMAEEAYK